MWEIMRRYCASFCLMLLAFPASNNYNLTDYSFGSGGSGESASNNYSGEFISGEVSSDFLESTTYGALPGLLFTQMAHVPPAPSFTNPDNSPNSLLIIVNAANNASDTTFAIAISDDNFATTQYVQSDNTVGSTLGSEDWQTYADWGGGSGTTIVGLDANTTYYVKVKAEQGNYTESPYGPVASAATSGLTLSFDIDVSAIDEETSGPYVVAFGDLSPGSVVTATEKVWIDISTTANAGGRVYVYGSNNGLYSSVTSHTISAVSGNLASLSEGYGIRYADVSQSSGGPLAAVSPFNGSNDVVGSLGTAPAPIFDSTSAVNGGRGSFLIKAKIDTLTPAASDYTDTITVIAAGSF